MSGIAIDAVWLPFIIEVPLVVFHTSVIVCICKQIHAKHAEFKSGFFAIYAVQSINDLLNYIWVSSANGCRAYFVKNTKFYFHRKRGILKNSDE